MDKAFDGRVIANYGRHMTVEIGSGRQIECRTKGRSLKPVCGDTVHGDYLVDGTGRITEIKTRRSLLVRHDSRSGQQPLASNIDRMMVVVAPKPSIDLLLIDKYLAAGEILQIMPVVILNKVDLFEPVNRSACEQLLDEYAAIGYTVLKTSAVTREGINALGKLLRGHTGVVVGQSGTGKSSLLKALVPDAEIRIGEISHATDEGRHTTTVSALYHLSDGGDLIDSPGVRGFQLWAMPARQLAEGFIEFRAYIGQCKFSDCTHLHEPGCKIIAAVETGDISERRYSSYRTLSAQNPD